MDLETRVINKKYIPYCISIYDSIKKNSFFISDYYNVESMIIAAIIYLSISKYDNHKFYFHNFAKFEVIFNLF
jgi:ABC-type arginine/histidine transport system permease subunit